MLPGSNGIEIAKRINELSPTCSIIFLTGYIAYASDVYETQHSYMVLKSELKQRAAAAFSKAISDILKDEHLSLKSGGTIRTISTKEVLFLERNLKKTFIFVHSGQKYSTAAKPEELLSPLSAHPFVQCHQSFWVNIDVVYEMTAESFTLRDGSIIPISRGKRKVARDAFYSSIAAQVSPVGY